jgi:serine/threonine-protein kinase
MVTPQVYGNRYEVMREIARGGMADVYLARDLRLDRPVAIKVLSAELSRDPTFVERFRLEARAAANLNHPNIVSVYDWGQEQDTSFIVMEYVEGQTLRELIHVDGTVAPAQVADIGAEIAAALSFAHKAGVVHRDVKPGNVLITRSGQVQVTDFGIARANGASDGLTRTGAVMGTATYFSPEQAQGLPVDGRSDVYSLGIVLYEMTTGSAPFTGDNPVSVAYKHVREPIPRPSERVAGVPPDLERIILTCLAKDPADRYQSADDLRADLLRFRRGQAIQGGPVTARVAALDATSTVTATPLPMGAPTAPPRDRKWTVALVVALIVVLVAGIGYLVYTVLQGGDDTGTVTVENVVLQQEAVARRTLEAQGLEVRVVRRANDQLASGIVVSQDPKAGTKIDRGSRVVLTVSDGKGSKPVEDVAGETLEDAQRTLEAQGFTVVVEHEPSETVDEGRVIRTDPEAGVKTPVGDPVTVVVSSGPAPVSVPDVVGQDQVAAAQTLGSAGFKVERSTQASSSVAAGVVISQDPAAGTGARRGDTVRIVVSSGPEEVSVPSVVGQSQSSAINALTDAGFKVSVQMVASSPGNVGKVIAQSPGGGSSASRGSTVTITVGAATASTTTTSTTGP